MKRTITPIFCLVLLILLVQSCANRRLKYHADQKNWKQNIPPTDTEIDHTMFLIGDAGYAKTGEVSPAIKLLQTKLAAASKNSSVIFLGDNIYPSGMPPKSDQEDRQQAEYRLSKQLDILEDFKGRPFFIPGNHDWRKYGLKGLKRQEKFIQKRLNKGIENDDDWEEYFIPSHGCGGPEVVEINDKLVIVFIDSQWWLYDWDRESTINDGCEAKSRKTFAFLFEEAVRKHRSKNVVIAMHHPVYTYGPHGGYFTARQHLFPLTDIDDDLKIPLPVLGSAVAFLRGTIGSKQDAVNQNYKALKDVVLGAAKKNGNYIFASGHEHSLQYIERDNQHFIVSGNGSKKTPTHLGKGADFAYGGSYGFAKMDFYKDGSVWVEYWVAPNKQNPEGEIVFRKKIKGELSIAKEDVKYDFSEYEEAKDSVTTYILNHPIKRKGGFHKLMLGAHYRDLYAEQYQMPVLDLDQFRGGVHPIKRGGGNQTNSLRLLSADGDQYVMRSMTKDASRFIPYPFNKITASEFIVEDNFLSTHPFAAIVVPELAKHVEVYHTNPKLYYIPKQPALAEQNDLFGGEVYLVEERPAKDWSKLASFGNSKKIIGVSDLMEKLFKNHKHKVDQPWVVRSRLFDLVIGDWDRHNDQWRWARFEQDGKKIYRPIPRDRDQPFAKYDGVMTVVIGKTVPFLKQLQEYSPKVKNIKWSTYGARSFDRTFLNALAWEAWEKEAKFIQSNLTDEAIDEAFRVLPDYAHKNSGLKLAEIVKKRRDDLVNIARKHYGQVAKAVDIYGTEKKEWFDVERLDDDRTRVRVYYFKKGKKEELVYDRIFFRKETKEIRLFGLGDKDHFEITGTVNKGILVRAIGGLDEDVFVDRSSVSGPSKKTKIYDSEKGNKLDLSSEGEDRTSKRRELNIFNTSDYHYEFDFMLPLPAIGFNPDDGFSLGANLIFTSYKYKKSPYGVKHNIKGQFAFATNAYDIAYDGQFVEAFGKADFHLSAKLQAPKFVINYFGSGNDTKNNFESRDSFNFNRVRQSLVYLQPSWQRRFGGDNGLLSIGILGERIQVQDTPNRFVTSDASGLIAQDFDAQYFFGPSLSFQFANLNNTQITSRGIRFLLGADFKMNVNESNQSYVPFRAELTIYQNLNPSDGIVLASRIGTHHNIGDYAFFQSAVLGGDSNIRGYRADRFYGRTSYYHNTDLRLRLFRSKNQVIPFTMGMHGGFDYGRVWFDNENSDTWHYAYGGGLWMAPIDFLILSGELFHSPEGNRFTFKVGFSF